MKNIANLMKQASDMQAKMEAITVEGSSGAGMVTVTLGGNGVLSALKIDPQLLNPEDLDVLQDLIVAAYADGRRRLDERIGKEMQNMTNGMSLPAGFNLPF